MRKASYYEQNAAECRTLAAKMPPEHREQLLAMAKAWEKMAGDRVKLVRKYAELLPGAED